MFTAFTPEPPIQWRLNFFEGKDCADFLQRLSTVNVRTLKSGTGRRGFFLSAQGKMRAGFWLWRLAEDRFGFEFDSGADNKGETELKTFIDQFTFGEKLTFTPFNGHCEWIFNQKTDQQSQATLLADGVWQFHHSSQDFGQDWISLWGEKSKVRDHLDAQTTYVTIETLDLWRIQTLSPWIGHELNMDVIPLETGMNDAIERGKGCFPGQEVTERMSSQGAPPRRLVRVTGTGSPPKKVLN